MFCGHTLRTVVLLQELAHSFGVAPDGVGLPLVVGAAGVGLVELGRLVVVEPGDEAGDAEGTATVGLGVPLLQRRNIPAKVGYEKSRGWRNRSILTRSGLGFNL
jgi:hypothetical protein